MLHNHKSLEHVTEKKLEDALNFGQTLASLNCNFVGARGMMYDLTKEVFKIVAKKLKNKEKPIELTSHTRKSKLTSKLASECKICLCST